METEVFLLCKSCNGLTNGIGSGDFRDAISCLHCNNQFVTAEKIGRFTDFDGNTKDLYMEEGFLNKHIYAE